MNPAPEMDATAPLLGPGLLAHDSLEQARLFHSIKSRLFDSGDEPLRLGAHRLVRRLGVGGMGEVYLAHDDELDRPVAIKLVHARLGQDGHFADRMRREARALARLAHPNVVHVYEVGAHEGRVFIAMEYVEGQSLGQWCHDCSPPWHSVLAAYLAAGEGLAAAHAVGLVHRDFKPENVLRGTDGRVCVADFGLARVNERRTDPEQRPGDDPSASGEGPPMLDARLSATGTVMGTPNYMPLEQIRGGIVDARSDQFAFCVALYEALWGKSPHAASTLGARERLLADDRPEVPRQGPVPRWVWPIVRRGLARDPERRWPDMPTLLAQLRRAPLRRRAVRRATTTMSALTLALVGGWLGGWVGPGAALAPCTVDAGALNGVWDDSRRHAIHTAFTATGRAPAGEAAARALRSLDAWAARWQAERASSCQATRIHGVQSEAMLDRRTACLERQRGEVEAIVGVFMGADADVVARVGAALQELPEPGECSLATLDAQAEPIADPATRAAVDAGYRSLARARVELGVGRIAEASALAGLAQTVGQTHDHVPLTLAAQVLIARVAIDGGELTSGLEQLHRVVIAAERARLLDLVASTRVTLARAAVGDAAEPRLESWLIDEAQLALDRVARPDDPRAVVLASARARLAEQAGKFADAIAGHRAAHALAEGRMDAGQRALLRVGIGTALYRHGDLTGARAELEQSLGVARTAWGPSAPEVARIHFNLSMVTTDLGEFDTARRHLESAIAIDEGAWGRDSLDVARDRFALAYLAFGRGEIDPGCALIDEVKAVYEARLGLDHDETASALNAAAVCRYYAGDFHGAIDEYRRALAIQTKLLGEGHREVALLYANIGDAHYALRQLPESLAAHDKALAILTAAVPDDHPELAAPLKGQALVRLAQGAADQALTGLERALQLADASRPGELAEIRFGLAQALVAVHGRREQARANTLAREALAGFEAVGSERQARPVRDWLARRAP